MVKPIVHMTIYNLNENDTIQINSATADRRMSHPPNGSKLQTTIPLLPARYAPITSPLRPAK